jgi:hypothetical protein
MSICIEHNHTCYLLPVLFFYQMIVFKLFPTAILLSLSSSSSFVVEIFEDPQNIYMSI